MLEIKSSSEDLATKQTEMLFEHLLQLQQWINQYGNLYALVTEPGQSDALVQNPETDLQTSSGQTLSRVVPFCISQKLISLSPETSHLQFHLVSLNPLNISHQADAWETATLTGFEKGESNKKIFEDIRGTSYFRYLMALPADSSCVNCHTQPSTSSKTPIAALSTLIPTSDIDASVSVRLKKQELAYFIIAIFGLVVILITSLIHQKLNLRLFKAKQHLKLAYMDVLTQLPNRRYYDYFVNREWKRAMRQNYPLSLIMVDIDYFKNYNDHFGHIQGDHCLQQVAKTLRHYFRRAGDLIARYGGEEFCVVAACDADQAKHLAEALRIAIENLQLPHPNSKVSSFVSISLGTATVIPTENMSYEELLQQADESLYLAKQNGRNRVETFKRIST
jgi:diguanylate cyclase (GGDEF)-like protein